MPQPCPTCGRELVSVDLSTTVRTVTMQSCSPCDQRWWLADGVPAEPVDIFAKRPA
jgi:transcription elongation factor Elf1